MKSDLWLASGHAPTPAETYLATRAEQERRRSERRTDFWFCAAILAVLAVNTGLVTVGAVVVSQWVLRVLH